MIFLDDDDDWNHLTKNTFLHNCKEGKEEKLFLTHFCVLLMLLESELHFCVFAPGFCLCSIVNYTSRFVMEIQSTKKKKQQQQQQPIKLFLLKTFIKLVN
jgi:hypothetical protein